MLLATAANRLLLHFAAVMPHALFSFRSLPRCIMKTERIRLSCAACSLAACAIAGFIFPHLAVRAAADSSWGFSLSNLDKTCKACDDFYEFAMGGWMKANPIPAEYASWGTFTQLRDNNLTAALHFVCELKELAARLFVFHLEVAERCSALGTPVDEARVPVHEPLFV